ncbi:MAG: coproporphyrinogen III oxidase [Alphaproteobacteria bacterium]|nr:coproporphyrinogen III oxidase [Alphaproteobacteria bacterium]
MPSERRLCKKLSSTLTNPAPLGASEKGQLGVYIHWPFCLSKCPYCDFNSHVREGIDEAAWRAAYVRSVEHYAQRLPGRQVRSIFFGGGTPSLMSPETAEAIISEIQKNWQVSNDVEITLEANPTSVEIEKFRAFQMAGVNRVSIGVQALNDTDLKFLGREHSAKEAIQAIETARKVFDRYSFDLIYARPEQSLSAWEDELARAQDLADSHLSLYQLTIERNTPFYMSHEQGLFSIPEEGLAADFYTLTQEVMEGYGLPAYEVSNHARAGEESRHNMIYWTYGDYVGIGPGAHGRITIDGRKYPTREHQAPDIWLDRAGKDGTAAKAEASLSHYDRFMEALMMGLRLRAGVRWEDLDRAAGHGESAQVFLDHAKLQTVQDQGWALCDDDGIALTQEGRLRLNALLPYILKEA